MSDEIETPFSKAVMDSMAEETTPPKEEVEATPPKEESTPPKEAEATPPKEELEEDDGQKMNWKALRESKKELEKRQKELEASRTDLEAQLSQTKEELEAARLAFNKDEFESLKKERDQLAMQLTELDLLRSPEVKQAQAKVTSEIQNAVKSIRRLLPDQEGLDRILQMEPEARDKAMAGLLEDAPASTASRVWGLVDRVDNAQQQVEEASSTAKENLSKWKDSQTNELQRKQQEERELTENLYLKGIQAAQEEMPELFQLKDGEDAHNKQVSERLSFTKKVLFEPMTEEETVQTAFLAGIGRTAALREKAFTEALAKSESERQALAEKLKAYEEAQPTGSSGATESGEQEVDVGSFAKTVMANLGS